MYRNFKIALLVYCCFSLTIGFNKVLAATIEAAGGGGAGIKLTQQEKDFLINNFPDDDITHESNGEFYAKNGIFRIRNASNEYEWYAVNNQGTILTGDIDGTQFQWGDIPVPNLKSNAEGKLLNNDGITVCKATIVSMSGDGSNYSYSGGTFRGIGFTDNVLREVTSQYVSMGEYSQSLDDTFRTQFKENTLSTRKDCSGFVGAVFGHDEMVNHGRNVTYVFTTSSMGTSLENAGYKKVMGDGTVYNFLQEGDILVCPDHHCMIVRRTTGNSFSVYHWTDQRESGSNKIRHDVTFSGSNPTFVGGLLKGLTPVSNTERAYFIYRKRS